MALPTHGRVILNTTVGEIDIELWSKVRTRISTRRSRTEMVTSQGNTKSVSKLYSTRTRRCVQQRTPQLASDLAFTGRVL